MGRGSLGVGGIIPEAGAVGKDKAELSINIPLSLLPDWPVLSNCDTEQALPPVNCSVMNFIIAKIQ